MQKKLSMFQVILLGIFGTIGVAGILIFAFAVGSTGSGSVGAVTIWGTFDATAMQGIIRNAAESETRLSQVTYEQKDVKTFESDLADALASGTGPDIFIMRQDYAPHDAGKVSMIPYTKLSQAEFVNSFVTGSSPFLGETGIVAIPMLVDPLVLYWNRDMVTSAGFAQPLKYWDELPKQAPQITKRSDSGNITKSAIALGEYENVDNAKDVLSMMIMQADGLIVTRDSSGRLTPSIASRSGDTAQSTETALRFYTEFADPSKDDYTWNRARPEARAAFAAGDLAYYIGYASEAPLIKQTNPNLNFSVSDVPQVRGGKAAIDYGRVYGLAIARHSINPKGAETVAFLLTGTPDISRQISAAVGIPSARNDVLAQAAQGNDTIFNKMAIIVRTWMDPNPVETAAIFKSMIEDTTSGSVKLNDAVQKADQELARVLGL